MIKQWNYTANLSTHPSWWQRRFSWGEKSEEREEWRKDSATKVTHPWLSQSRHRLQSCSSRRGWPGLSCPPPGSPPACPICPAHQTRNFYNTRLFQLIPLEWKREEKFCRADGTRSCTRCWDSKWSFGAFPLFPLIIPEMFGQLNCGSTVRNPIVWTWFGKKHNCLSTVYPEPTPV